MLQLPSLGDQARNSQLRMTSIRSGQLLSWDGASRLRRGVVKTRLLLGWFARIAVAEERRELGLAAVLDLLALAEPPHELRCVIE